MGSLAAGADYSTRRALAAAAAMEKTADGRRNRGGVALLEQIGIARPFRRRRRRRGYGLPAAGLYCRYICICLSEEDDAEMTNDEVVAVVA